MVPESFALFVLSIIFLLFYFFSTLFIPSDTRLFSKYVISLYHSSLFPHIVSSTPAKSLSIPKLSAPIHSSFPITPPSVFFFPLFSVIFLIFTYSFIFTIGVFTYIILKLERGMLVFLPSISYLLFTIYVTMSHLLINVVSS